MSDSLLVELGLPRASVWNPHHGAAFVAAASGASVTGWDTRQSAPAWKLDAAHTGGVRTVDFNPNKQYHTVTGGDDGLVKFWDTRNRGSPLLAMANHTHWVWGVRYNQFHDQLLISGGGDSEVALFSVGSLSSDLFSHSAGEETAATPAATHPDELIARFDEHEDSVYAVEWSAVDPWLFASLSYDGRLVINHVPQETKYRILL